MNIKAFSKNINQKEFSMFNAQIRRKLTLVALSLLVLLPVSAFGNNPASDNSSEQQCNFDFYKPPVETSPYRSVKTSQVKNVILFIGDGMGLGPIALARMTAAGPDGKLYMERMPVTGFVRTHSADAFVTDSAAAATALATGMKTNNGMVSVGPDGEKYLTTLEAVQSKGMLTGLIATSSVTHATPACFGAHNQSRQNQPEIAEGLLANKINLIFGGGREYFLPETKAESKRKDEKNLILQAENLGYSYLQTAEQLDSAHGPYVLGLFQSGALTTEPPEPSLAELTQKALEILSQKEKGLFKKDRGFFLMVEGSQIDWACHSNDSDAAIRQLLLFDLAVKAGVDFARNNPQTLVIVTADHDTGGLVISSQKDQKDNLSLSWSTTGHTALPVPLFAFGAKAEIFGGTCDNTDIAKKIAELLGIKSFPAIKKESAAFECKRKKNPAQPVCIYN
jgi:alkaline phosphatase